MGIFARYRTHSPEGKKHILRIQVIGFFLFGLLPLGFLVRAPEFVGERLSDHWVSVESGPYAYTQAYATAVRLRRDDGGEGRQGTALLILPNAYVRSRSCLYDPDHVCEHPAHGREGVLAKGQRFVVRLDTSQRERGLVVNVFDAQGRSIFSREELLAWLDGYRFKLRLYLLGFWGWSFIAACVLVYRTKYGWKDKLKQVPG